MQKISLIIVLILLLTGCADSPQPTSSKEKTNDDLLLHVPSPEWQDQVVYFLMLDRFNDGDPTNNDQGAGEYDPSISSHYSGGDLQGVIDQLDYLQNMGMTAVWTTPWVANQWWGNAINYGGYHGYWAVDFSAVDAHNGDMDTLKRLSDALHRRGMYLVQDIVVNHTGNFFNYKNGHDGYDPNDTAKNFYLMEAPDSIQPKPTQSPFDLIDRTNPEHAAANIYNWTPTILDYKNVAHQYTYQLATLADINTTNPVVIDRFKEIYADWIKNVGVDAFRIDTVRYVENEFFHHFMHDDDGIFAAAKSTGRDNFLAFGEVFDTSLPYENDAEKRVASYLGSPEKPELNSQISFPLHQELKTVFGQGFPTDQLAYRIKQHMEIYDNPYIFPTFIDNHDMGRFLTSGDEAGLKQALATIFTIPGIPTIYQGTAQAMIDTRKAMFKGGYKAEKGYFDQTSELFLFIQKLAKMRTSDRLFTRGDFNVIASNKIGPGIFAYTRQYQGRKAVIMFNTSPRSILVNKIKVSDQSATLKPLFGSNESLSLDASGNLTTELSARSIYIAEVEANDTTTEMITVEPPVITTAMPGKVITEDFLLEGKTMAPGQPLVLVKNKNLDNGIPLEVNDSGEWQYSYRVNQLGEEKVSVLVYHPEQRLSSNTVTFTTRVNEPEQTISITDPANDDTGPTGTYSAPQHSQSIGQLDILGATAKIGGDILELELRMRELTNDWIPPNGFDNVAFSIFFDANSGVGNTVLPIINSSMPSDWQWDMGHVVYGWGNTTYSTANATAKTKGKKFGIAPQVVVNKENKTISFRYRSTDFNIAQWSGTKIFITTWDITGEGVYRDLSPSASDWSFGGGETEGAKILDSIEVVIP